MALYDMEHGTCVICIKGPSSSQFVEMYSPLLIRMMISVKSFLKINLADVCVWKIYTDLSRIQFSFADDGSDALSLYIAL